MNFCNVQQAFINNPYSPGHELHNNPIDFDKINDLFNLEYLIFNLETPVEQSFPLLDVTFLSPSEDINKKLPLSRPEQQKLASKNYRKRKRDNFDDLEKNVKQIAQEVFNLKQQILEKKQEILNLKLSIEKQRLDLDSPLEDLLQQREEKY